MVNIIKREAYLKKLLPMIDTEFIQVITGVRRSGKSYLLLMLKDYLTERGILPERIVYPNFEYPKNHKLLDYDSLFAYLEDKLSENKKTYLLFDEI